MSSIKKNFLYNVLYQILVMILPLITAPYISRVLGPEGVGIYSYTYSVVYYFMLIAMLGINNYGNRQIAKVRDDKEKLSKTFSSIYLLQLIMSIIMIGLYIIYTIFIVKVNKDIAAIQIIFLLSTVFDINWFYFGIEQFKMTVTKNIVIKIISVILMFVLVKTKNDLIIYTIIMSVSTLISQLYLWLVIKKYIKFERIKLKNICVHIKPCLILFIPVIAVSLYKIMDKIMLGIMSDMNQVGYYENAEKIVNIPMGLITALGTVMLPKISNLIVKGKKEAIENYIKKSIQFEFITSSALAFGIMAIVPIFIPMFLGKEFIDSVKIAELLSITIIFLSVANVIRTQYLIPNEKDKSYIVSVFIGAIVNVIINIMLIPKLKSVGAAIGTLLAELSVFAYQLFDVRKEINIKEYIKDGMKYIVLGIVMFIMVRNVYFKTSEILLLIIRVSIGAFIYISGVIVIKAIEYKEKNLKNILLKLKNLE